MKQVHLLDVGKRQYGDSILLKLGDHTILIDGGNPSSFSSSHPHDSIPKQLKELIGGSAPYNVSLLIVTHAHNDHIGCLPKMVAEGVLTADWALIADPDLGWGIVADGHAIDEGQDIEVSTMMAAMREEPMIGASDEEVAEFLMDSQTLRSRYREMLESLEESGTEVVPYHGLDEADELLAVFADIGMQILGPDPLMLLKCANRIEELGRDFIDFAARDFAEDSTQSEVERYRRLVESTDFAALDAGGIGAALNCMSLILMFEVDDVRVLMTGDMQFTAPGIPGDNHIDDEMTALRQRISDEAPFDLYKIGHHGSHNSFDEDLLDELNGTINFAVSTGRNSRSHPDGSVLQLLKSKVDDIFWVRTDRNGKCSFDFEDDPPSIDIDRGIFTDWRKNHVDSRTSAVTKQPPEREVIRSETTSRPPVTEPIRTKSPVSSGRDDVEVITRVPHRRTKVTVAINVEPGDEEPDGVGAGMPPKTQPTGQTDLNSKPRLAFVTDHQLLAANIGAIEADSICAEIAQSHHLLIDVTGHGHDPQAAARQVRTKINGAVAVNGVVILGGYDVVPSEILDVLPSSVRQQLGVQTGDPDNFIVWSDDLFGDLDGDSVAELPVSRIPDGRSAEVIQKSLASSPPAQPASRQGVRNVRRPFADGVFDILTVSGEMFPSHPTVHTQVPELSQDFVYLMLHGSYLDATEFHGEGTVGGLPAVRMENIPDVTSSSVVFCGCCWGALIVDKPAVRAAHDAGATARTAGDSIPLRFLASGANAFVGCTGVHYSPIKKPYRFFGGPMHEAFWREIVSGIPPAQALFNAKTAYIEGMFHGREDVVEHAIEYKILRQFTCLGLGW